MPSPTSPCVSSAAISLEYLEDDYEWENDGNVDTDPKLPIVVKTGGYVSSYDVKAANTKANTVRGILGQNLQGNSLNPTVGAFPMRLNPNDLPFPQEAKAKKYGVNPSRVEQF